MSRVRVATYNLYLGADLSLLLGDHAPPELAANAYEVQRQLQVTAFPARVDAVAEVLLQERPDLVGVQEVCTWTVGGELQTDFEGCLIEALAARGEPYERVARTPTFAGHGEVERDGARVEVSLTGSNAVLRRIGSAAQVTEALSGDFEAAHRTVIQGSTAVTIHRGWCAVRCTVAGEPLFFATTHTEAYHPESRDRQRDEMLAALAAVSEPVVLVGDFNAPPEEVAMPAEFVDAWVAAGNPTGGATAHTSGQAADLSNPDSSLDCRIDYVWVRGARVTGCRRRGAERGDRTSAGVWPSDHACVVADVELSGSSAS